MSYNFWLMAGGAGMVILGNELLLVGSPCVLSGLFMHDSFVLKLVDGIT